MLSELRRIAKYGKGAPRKRLVVCILHVGLWPAFLIARLFWPRRKRVEGIRRILLIRMDGIGDLAMTAAIFPAIRQKFPDAKIDLLGSNVARKVAELWVSAGWIDTLYTMPLLGRTLKQYLNLATEFRASQYDAAIDLRGDMRNVLLMWLAGIPHRVGVPEAGFGYLLSDVVELPEGAHQAEESAEMVRRIGVTQLDPWPRIPLRPEDYIQADQWLKTQGLNLDRPICALHLSAFLPVKVWPLERFVAVARELQREFGMQILVIGGPDEQPLADRFAAELGAPVTIATGKTEILLTAAILSRCSLFIGNDSGPAHLAACVGCPVIDLFGPADPRRYRPLSPYAVAMSPHTACDPACDKVCARPATHCILDHTVEKVLETARILLDRRAQQPDQPSRC